MLYEISSIGQYFDEELQEIVAKPFDNVSKAFDDKVKEIEAEVWATEPSLFFMTNNAQLHKAREKKKAKALKRASKRAEENPLDDVAKDMVELYQPSEYVPNFRDDVAKKKVYKGSRKNPRPIHYENLVAYVCATREVIVAEGCEADDLLAIHQTAAKPLTTVICSRDKDLKIIEGMHFGWACGKQPQFPLTRVDGVGEIKLSGRNKLSGTGLKFFYSQVLTGDKTDDYPGLPRCGDVKAFKLLNECDSEGELFEAVLGAYRDFYGEETCREEMLEQCQLAWMVKEVDDDGNLIHYKMFDERLND